MNLIRTLNIFFDLRTKRLSSKFLSQKYKVTERQIRRDISTLIIEGGINISSKAGNSGGYFIDDEKLCNLKILSVGETESIILNLAYFKNDDNPFKYIKEACSISSIVNNKNISDVSQNKIFYLLESMIERREITLNIFKSFKIVNITCYIDDIEENIVKITDSENHKYKINLCNIIY